MQGISSDGAPAKRRSVPGSNGRSSCISGITGSRGNISGDSGGSGGSSESGTISCNSGNSGRDDDAAAAGPSRTFSSLAAAGGRRQSCFRPWSDTPRAFRRLQDAVRKHGGNAETLLSGWRAKVHESKSGKRVIMYHPPTGKPLRWTNDVLEALGLAATEGVEAPGPAPDASGGQRAGGHPEMVRILIIDIRGSLVEPMAATARSYVWYACYFKFRLV